MEYVKLGNSDLNVSRICLGCMGFGDASIGQRAPQPLRCDGSQQASHERRACMGQGSEK